MQLKITNGYAGYQGDTVLEQINFEINDKDKIAIVGRNGCGKTTLLKLMEGELELMTDCSKQPMSISRSNGLVVGVLRQLAFDDDSLTLEEEMLKIYKPITDMQAQIEELQKVLERSPTDENIKKFTKLNEKFKENDGYFYKKEYQTALKKFGFSEADYSKKLSEFSGGQRTRLAFIVQLLSKPDLLLLDEPTNHLDIEAIEWLEGYLKSYKKAVVLVSHDREFLDNVVNCVSEIEHKHLVKYVGNYTKFLQLKQERYVAAKKAYEERKEEIAALNDTVERFRYKATKAKMVQSKIKLIERIDTLDNPDIADTRTFRGAFTPLSDSGTDVLFCKGLAIGYDKNALATVNAEVFRGDRVAVIGGNGIGKSTFMKTIVGAIPKISGEYKIGAGVQIGYFDQQIASKPSNDSVLESFLADYPALSNLEARSELGRFLFTGEDVFKKVSELSGGERVRLTLCKLFKKRPNLLILDEPTNHMDILSKEALEEMLIGYTGTLIFVSHDRYFVKKTATKILAFENGKAEYYPLPYTDYLLEKERLRRRAELTYVNDSQKVQIIASEKPQSAAKLSYEAGKERQRAIRKIASINNKIDALELKLKGLNEDYASDKYMSDYLALERIHSDITACEDEILALLEEKDKCESLVN